MKNNKIRITLATVVALTLLVCAAFAISVSADETNEKIPQVISQNICYQGDFAIMYAVDASTVAEGAVTLNVYTEYPGENATPAFKYEVKTPTTIKIENGEGGFDEISVYEFKTNGISAKDMADIFYIQAVDSANNKSIVSTYSVAHYMYERLYGGYTLTDDQRALYESCLIFGSNAQKVLAKDDANLVTDYKYLKVKDGYFASSNAYSDVFVPNSSVIPVYTGAPTNDAGDEFAGWTLTDLVTGAVSTIKYGDPVIASANMSVVPKFGLTYLTFEKNGADNMPTLLTDSSQKNLSIENVLREGAADDNKVLKYTKDAAYREVYINKTATDDVNADAFVFESYVNFNFSASCGNDHSKGVQCFFVGAGQTTSGTIFARPFIYWNGEGTDLNMMFRRPAGSGSNYFGSFSLGVKAGEWFKLRIELCYKGEYSDAPVIKVFVNDSLVKSENYYETLPSSATVTPGRLLMNHSATSVLESIMFDNTELMYKEATK